MRRPLGVSLAAIATLLAATMFITQGKVNFASAQAQKDKQGAWAIVIHGGAGSGGTTSASDKPLSAREELLRSYVIIGKEILVNGGSALDACEKVVRTFEDSGKFNTGKGANATGKNPETSEPLYFLDAAIMDGSNLGFGAISGVKHIKNPVTCARAVMNTKDHVLLIEAGAELFAKKQGLEIVPPSYFNVMNKVKKKYFDDDFDEEGHGTVGCVCLDMSGNVAAATSTGGRGVVLPGRVGCVPICGAGTYANNKTCAVSGTGVGENHIRHMAGHTVSTLMEYKGLSVQQAADEVIHNIMKKGSGGIIVVSHTGDVAFPFNGGSMARGAANSAGRFEVGIGKEMRKVQ